ncbi:polysaccharide deacetylase family protein [Pararhizobium gei]|uniref:polysaccharide deacetylase family protein n=1 Tax=Pararhizobium gei TaxID=1395951 RepID=UPI0023DAA676|nr:polysaccharide deacetylase family protein [Rhizobium gei]
MNESDGSLNTLLRKLAKRAVITGGLEAARLAGLAGLMGSARGRGAIFTLHHVRPKAKRVFEPNAHLEITPGFLETAIVQLKRCGYIFLALDALPAHLASNDPRPAAVFTLDDGYRNNLDHAAPIFFKHGVPFTVFVTGGFVDRTDILWWEVLADLLERNTSLKYRFDNSLETLPARTQDQKQTAFDRIAAFTHAIDEAAAIGRLRHAAELCGLDCIRMTADLVMDEAGLKTLIENPLASLGAHTITHRALARLTDGAARSEMDRSAQRVEAITGRRPSTFAYPYGDTVSVSPREYRLARDLGFTAAVTTQPGTLSSSQDLAALPRISLNGHFQKAAYVGALASGIPFKLMGRG